MRLNFSPRVTLHSKWTQSFHSRLKEWETEHIKSCDNGWWRKAFCYQHSYLRIGNTSRRHGKSAPYELWLYLKPRMHKYMDTFDRFMMICATINKGQLVGQV